MEWGWMQRNGTKRNEVSIPSFENFEEKQDIFFVLRKSKENKYGDK